MRRLVPTFDRWHRKSSQANLRKTCDDLRSRLIRALMAPNYTKKEVLTVITLYQRFALTITSIKIKLTLCLSVSNIQNHQNETPSQLTPIKYLLPFLFSFFFFQTRDRCDY